MNKLPFEETSRKTTFNTVRFNPEDYMQHLEGMDLTDGEARDVLSALWDIMVQFVDLGFQVELDSNANEPVAHPNTCEAKPSQSNKCRITNKGERRP